MLRQQQHPALPFPPPQPLRTVKPSTSGSLQQPPGRSAAAVVSQQELLMLQQWRRDWRTIAFAAAVGVVVLLVIVITASLLSGGLGWREREECATMEDILAGKYAARKFNGTWITDEKILFQDQRKNAIIFDVRARKHHLLTTNRTMITRLAEVKYTISSDLNYILITHNATTMFKSFVAQFEIYFIANQTSIPLLSAENTEDRHLLNLAVWSPGGNGLAYVYHNNIYYRPTVTSDDFQLTDTGLPNLIYNGVPDSNYQGGWYINDEAVWFSPNGKILAYASFNDSLVNTIPVVQYFNYYPQVTRMHYPKPGTNIPEVSVHLIKLEEFMRNESNYVKHILPPQDFDNRDPILCGVTWPSNLEVVVLWKNRVQTVAKIMVCPIENHCHEVYTTDNRNAWVDIDEPPIFSPDGMKMILIDSHEQDNNEGHFRHITLVHRKAIQPVAKPLTEGTFSVMKIVSWDTNNRKIYFLATTQESSSVLHMYSVSDNPKFSYNSVKCLTCHLSSKYHHAVFSTNNSFYILQCLGPDPPEILLFSKDHKQLDVLDSNQELRARLGLTLLPATMTLQVDVPEGYKAQVKLWLPPTWDISKNKYPMIVNVFGAPSSCGITDQYNIDWRTYLTVNRSVVYAVIEGRGSGCKGDRIMHEVYRNLGAFEVEDQIHVTRKILDMVNFIESSKVAIWGWNYGGYVAAMSLAMDVENVFKCGIAVAPITSWLHYHAMYTERYMGLPTMEDNLSNYIATDLLNNTENFRHKKLFLVHGTSDDIVNYQHSMLLAKVLQNNNILFRQMSYTDDSNDLKDALTHLYHSMENFFEEYSILEW